MLLKSSLNEVIISVSPERQNPQTQQRSRSPVPGPSRIGRRNLTASIVQSASTVSVVVNVLTGSGPRSAAVKSSRFLSVISQTDLKRLINEKMQRESRKYFVRKNSCVNSRILFEETNCELFFFPAVKNTRDSSRYENIINNLSLLDLGPPWGVVVCFFLKCNKRIYPSIKSQSFFKEKNGFPEGVNAAVPLCFLSKGFSLLFCETGRITISSGQAVLEGLELVILQKKHGKMISLFCKKNTLSPTSPVRPLPLCNNKPFIRVRCCCRASGFSFFLNIPVLTKSELKEEPYNVTSNQKCNIFQLDNFCNHLIAFPDDMGMHLPFDGFIGGKLICSLQRKDNPIVQLIFIPDSVRLKAGIHFSCSFKFFNWTDEDMQFSQEQASRNIISIYNFPQVTLSFNFELEATISGLEIKLISTKNTGSWGVLLSRKETGSLSASMPHTGQESNNSPVPGPSRACPLDKSTAEESLNSFSSKDFFQDLSEEDVQSRQSFSSHMDCLTTVTLKKTLSLIDSETKCDILKEINLSHPADLLPDIETVSPLVSFEELCQSQMDCLTTVTLEETISLIDSETKGDILKEINLSHPADLLPDIETVSPLVSFEELCQSQMDYLTTVTLEETISLIDSETKGDILKEINLSHPADLLPDIETVSPLVSFEELCQSQMDCLTTVTLEETLSLIDSETKGDILKEINLSHPADLLPDIETVSPLVSFEELCQSQMDALPESFLDPLGVETNRDQSEQQEAAIKIFFSTKSSSRTDFYTIKEPSLEQIDSYAFSSHVSMSPIEKARKEPFLENILPEELFLPDAAFLLPPSKKKKNVEESLPIESDTSESSSQNSIHALQSKKTVPQLTDTTSESEVDSSTDFDTSEKPSQTPERVFQKKETSLLQPTTDTVFIEVETTTSTEVSLPYPVCSMTSIHGMQRSTFSIPYTKSVVFYKEVNSQINAMTLERKKLFLSGQSLLAVLPKQVSFQHGVGFENAQLSVVRENKSSKIFIGFIPINNSRLNPMSHWVIRQWGHPYLSNVKGNLSRIQLVSLRGYLFECPLSATIKMISSTECVLLGMSFVILTDSNSSSPVAFLFAQNESLLSFTEKAGKGSSSNTLFTSVHRPQAKRLLPTESKGKAKRKKKNRVESLMEGASGSDANILQSEEESVLLQPTDTASEVEEEETDTAFEVEEEETDTASEVEEKETDTASEVEEKETDTASEVEEKETDTASEVEEKETDTASEVEEKETDTASEVEEKETDTASEVEEKETDTASEVEEKETDTASEVEETVQAGSVAEVHRSQAKRHFTTESKDQAKRKKKTKLKSLMQGSSSIESDASKKHSQSPERVQETSLLQPTGTDFIEVETTAPTGAVTTEDSTEVSFPYPVCSMISIHGIQRATFSIPYTKRVIFYKEVNLQVNEVILERKELFSDGKNLLAVLPKQANFQHGVGFENAQLSVVKDKKSSKISIGFIPINQPKTHPMSYWVHKKWTHPYLSNVKGNLARMQLISLRAYLFECPLSATIKMISSTECVLLGMSVFILTDSNSSPIAFLFARNEGLLSLTEEVGEGSSSNTLSTSVHRPQAKRLLPTESKGQAKRKKKNRVESLMEGASGSDANILQSETDTDSVVEEEETDTASEVEETVQAGSVAEVSIESNLSSPACSMISIQGLHEAIISIPYKSLSAFYEAIKANIRSLEKNPAYQSCSKMTLERKTLFSLGENLLAFLPRGVIVQHEVGFANAQLSILKEEGSGKIFIGFIPMNQMQSYFLSYFAVNKWCHPYLSKVKGKLSRMPLGSLRSYLFECPSSVTVKMISATECALVGMSVVIFTEPRTSFHGVLLFLREDS